MKTKGTKGISEISFKDALIVGTLQGAAIFPAVSRSGSTIAGALFRGINRQAAARFSFLLSMPAILGAVVLQSKRLVSRCMETSLISWDNSLN
nr:undecaprenyl-diphosphate phosphatase [Desulforamulus aquiferis]